MYSDSTNKQGNNRVTSGDEQGKIIDRRSKKGVRRKPPLQTKKPNRERLDPYSLIFTIDCCMERKERDSNPRTLAGQRFSRPPQSTTLPSFLLSHERHTVQYSFHRKSVQRYINFVNYTNIGHHCACFFSIECIFSPTSAPCNSH